MTLSMLVDAEQIAVRLKTFSLCAPERAAVEPMHQEICEDRGRFLLVLYDDVRNGRLSP